MERLCPSGHAGDRGPGLEGLGPGGAILAGGEVIAAEVEEIVDPVMGGEEALGLARRLEALHLPLASSGRLLLILCSVIQALVPPVLDRGHHLSLRSAVAGQLVRDHDTRGPALLLQQLAEQAFGGPLVAPLLDENVEHDPILVDGPPEPVLLSADHQAHLASRAGESHPHALPEPYVTLSRHTAPDVRPFPCGMENGFALATELLPLPVGSGSRQNTAAPLVQFHYRTFLPPTSCSAPVPRLGTLILAV